MELLNDLNNLKFLFEQPRLFLSNHFEKIKNKIDIAFSQKEILSLYEKTKWMTLIKTIEIIEDECLHSFKSNEFEDNFIKTFNSIEANVKNKRKLNSTRKLIKEVETSLKRSLFMNKTIEYFECFEFIINHYEDPDVMSAYSSFLLVINDDHFSSEFIQSSLGKLIKIKGCAIGSYVTKEDLFITREMLKIKLIYKTLKNFNCESLDKQIRCEHIHLIEINVQNLTYLDLSSSNIVSMELDSFDGMVNLKELNLSRNKIERLEDNVFRGLTNLQVLNLMQNNILFIESLAFVDIKFSLKKLGLGVECMRMSFVEEFKRMSFLTELTLTFVTPMILICIKSFGDEKKSFEEILKEWKQVRTHLKYSNFLVLVSDRKSERPFQLVKRTNGDEHLQIMALNDQMQKIDSLLNIENMFEKSLETRLNHLKLYETKLRLDEEILVDKEMKTFFLNFDFD